MKKLAIVSVIAILGLSSCAKRYTCPTYLKNEDKQEDVWGKNNQELKEETKATDTDC